ncbi:hypothetical protein [Mesorhizobium sp. BR-1-1-10]|uniref:hypothetical protein n=1 Tax=Mesorhizobium sp. BR-1-1-10 TaxID=2876660 RepID=UPI001CD05CEB|nr:hypothetical protein [Mesorhizobium sp. BR-1-1-10]MBZ9974036.1 hypothetical protein [Mesorhizobium sp. BR-1-1-10]
MAAAIASTLDSAHASEITREQCELIRQQLIASATASKNAHEAVRDINLAALDLVLLKLELEQLGGDKLRPVTDRLQKSLDTISAASSHAASEKGIVAKGALAFMHVCGPPPT